MGYRGEDASRTRADSRRQSPWQSSDTGPGAAASWDDESQGYGPADGYTPGGEYDSYAGYGDYGQSGDYGATDGYGATGSYGVTGTYETGGYAGGGGYGSGYDQDGGYGHTGSYGQAAGYRDSDNGYSDNGYGENGYSDNGHGYGGHRGGGFGSGPYEQPQAGGGRHSADRDTSGHRTGSSGGYPALGYQASGYPALGAGSGGQGASPGRHRDAGNDWYSSQPGASSGSGFADTGVHTFGAQALESYGTSPRDPVRGFPPAPGRPLAELEAGTPQGLVQTGQQERYDDTQYDAYPAYGGHDDYDDPRGYGASGGYPTSSDYDEPQSFGALGYDSDPRYDNGPGYDSDPGYDNGLGYDTDQHGDRGRGYDDYQDEDAPYQERYRDDGTGPRRAGTGGRKTKTRKSKTPRSKKSKSGKRSKRPLLISLLAIVAVGVVVAAVYTFTKPKPPVGNPSASTGALPTSSASISAATAECARELGEYCHIQLRTDDPVPLTLAELFPPAFTNETDHTSFTRIGTRLDKTCSNGVIGQDLISALQSDHCTQVLRASYVSGDNTIMGTIGVINLATTTEAHHAGKVVGANDFISPLSTKTGIGSKLGSGTGVVEAEFKGHYLILTWAEFIDGKAPKTTAQDEQLEQFETDLVAGTANIYLSERMVNGMKATAAS